MGVTFLILGCALPQYNNWWPMFVLTFYFLVPIPSLISRRYAESTESSSVIIEVCLFITTGIVVSAFGLPIVLAHKTTIAWGACGLIHAGNVVVFITILMFFYIFGKDDAFDYSAW